ncbi:MAG: YdcH family protein [Acidobacteria bacterium]|nr:YdcH family protein [Acidobacteriota bacterium]MCL5286408.1 YdcH family protein [Acidobacteriota bacterium]
MPNVTRELREQLLTSNSELQRLAQEHSQYERQVQQLTKDPYLSVEDINRLAALKKMKLRVKDEMEQLIARHFSEQAVR